MNSMQVFNFNGNTVRTVLIDNEPYFVGKDVAENLGYKNTSKALKDNVDDEDKGVTKVTTLGGTQETIVINESGVYALVFGSKLPTAKKFKHWVTHDVLPTIRKTGGFHVPKTYKESLKQLIITIEENERLQIECKAMKGKADYFDQLVERNLLTNFRNTAKELKVGEKEFVQFLIENKYIYRSPRGQLLPYASRKTEGLFEVKECINHQNSWVGQQTLITPKGRETFRLLLQ